MVVKKVDLGEYDLNTSIARASERQHQVNIARHLHYLGFIAITERITSIQPLLSPETTLEQILTLLSDSSGEKINDPDQERIPGI